MDNNSQMQNITIAGMTRSFRHIVQSELRDKVLDQYQDFLEQVNKIEFGERRARSVYEALNRLASEFHKRKASKDITCRKGCSHCCYMFVQITRSEALFLAKLAKNAKIDKQRLEKQAACKDVDSFISLSKQDRQCVFLKNNKCSIYNNRPSACRTYYVVSDPKLCQTDTAQDVSVIFDAMSEILVTAFMNADGENSHDGKKIDLINIASGITNHMHT